MNDAQPPRCNVTRRYIYFNRHNLAIKCSLKTGRASHAGRLGLSATITSLLNRTHADLSEGSVREVAFRSSGDGWVVGRVSGHREFYMLFDSKHSNLNEVAQEVQALGTLHFSNIFLD